jgi:uncharacterized membrane protein YdcZ (DUF606 family)
MPDWLYFCGLACLFTHELDAIQQEEWRFFFGWSPLSDRAAYGLFTALHVPLFALIMANAFSPGFRVGMSIFMMVHVVLHVVLRRYVDFNSAFSWVWIAGAGVCGAAYVMTRMI